jgi:FHA domain
MVRCGGVSHARPYILPTSLVAEVRAATREGYVEAFGDTKLLVIRLDPKAPELELGLAEVANAPSAAWRPRSGVTGVGTMILPISDQFLRAASTSLEARRQLSSKKLQALFSTRPHFLLPLRKRAGDGSADQLVVGRSNTNDVVLRHPSVSKLHATLEWDEAGIHYVSDEGSTNNTQLNGRVLAVGEPATFGPGDLIRFGDVEAFVCLPETFWDALSG